MFWELMRRKIAREEKTMPRTRINNTVPATPVLWPIASQRKATDLTDVQLSARRAVDTYFRRRGQIVGGTVDAVYAAGGATLMDWLSKQTPEGATISETMAAIALDAMHEETDE
jgi:hypothetical protein